MLIKNIVLGLAMTLFGSAGSALACGLDVAPPSSSAAPSMSVPAGAGDDAVPMDVVCEPKCAHGQTCSCTYLNGKEKGASCSEDSAAKGKCVCRCA